MKLFRSGPLVLHAAAAGLAFAMALVWLWQYWPSVIDDAYISYQYGRNLADGAGLVFNPGERVEGFSNPLWVVFIAAGRLCGIEPVLCGKFLGLASLMWLLLSFAKILRPAGALYVVTGAAILLVNPMLIFHSVGGLETVFFAALVLQTAITAAQERPAPGAAALLCAALVLARPEGAAYAVLLAAVYFVAHRGRGASAGLPGVSALLAAAALSVFRLDYYGSLLPNTFAAKASAIEDGAASLAASSLLASGEYLLLLQWIGGACAVPLIVLGLHSVSTRNEARSFGAALAAAFSFALYSGQDWMGIGRFLVPALAPLLALALLGLHRLLRGVPNALQTVLSAVLILAFSASGVSTAVEFFRMREKYPYFILHSWEMRAAAVRLRALFPAHYQIACWRIGALAYYSGLRVIDDRIGLTEPAVAALRRAHAFTPAEHARFIEARRPELYLERGRPGSPPAPTLVFGALAYRYFAEFAQGSDETWLLYLRQDLPELR